MSIREAIELLQKVQDDLLDASDDSAEAGIQARAVGLAIEELRRKLGDWGSSKALCGCSEVHQYGIDNVFYMTFTPCEKHRALNPVLHYVRCVQAAQKLGVEEFIRRISLISGHGDKVELR